MRAKCALYVDVGYLLASAATRVTGTSLRNAIHVRFGQLIHDLIIQAEESSGLPMLRVHWYDSARHGIPDAQQERIGELARVKLRLGRFGVDGQQKGVDLRIGLDLVTHARNGTADVFYLVSGDDDLTEAVEEAQVHGVEVVILAVPNDEGKPHAVSRHLIRACDQVETIAADTIDLTVLKVEVPEPDVETSEAEPVAVPTPSMLDRPAAQTIATIPTPKDLAGKPVAMRAVREPAAALVYSVQTGQESYVVPDFEDAHDYESEIDSVVHKVVAAFRSSSTVKEQVAIAASRPSVPRDIDRALLQDLCEVLQVYDLSDAVRVQLRSRFWEVFDATG